MTTSSFKHKDAYVWTWLPGHYHPVVAGKIERDAIGFRFNYGRSYLNRPDAIPIYDDLPLAPGVIRPKAGMIIPSSIRDAAPDSWGRRVIERMQYSSRQNATANFDLDELTYLLESDSDRIGALDFQRSSSKYQPRISVPVSLVDLQEAADRISQGLPLPPALANALMHGSSPGGARPKALIDNPGTKAIAKFSLSTDSLPFVKAEFVAMQIAALAGMDVAKTSITKAAHRDVLIVDRFDRESSENGWLRKGMISALTVLGLDEMSARYASYTDLGEVVRQKGRTGDLVELFRRVSFNVVCGNSDDHARNHAFFWDGEELTLTPAYDICPQNRAGEESSQAMIIGGRSSRRDSRLSACMELARHFSIRDDEAIRIMLDQMNVVGRQWNSLCDQAGMTTVERSSLMGHQFLNPFITNDLPDDHPLKVKRDQIIGRTRSIVAHNAESIQDQQR